MSGTFEQQQSLALRQGGEAVATIRKVRRTRPTTFAIRMGGEGIPPEGSRAPGRPRGIAFVVQALFLAEMSAATPRAPSIPPFNSALSSALSSALGAPFSTLAPALQSAPKTLRDRPCPPFAAPCDPLVASLRSFLTLFLGPSLPSSALFYGAFLCSSRRGPRTGLPLIDFTRPENHKTPW